MAKETAKSLEVLGKLDEQVPYCMIWGSEYEVVLGAKLPALLRRLGDSVSFRVFKEVKVKVTTQVTVE